MLVRGGFGRQVFVVLVHAVTAPRTSWRIMRTQEREGYIERLGTFVEEHRARLEELLRAYGPGSRSAEFGRYALIGQPETLVLLERMETAPFLLRSRWDEAFEAVLLADLEFDWEPRVRVSR
ncbi:hypothetical protein [Streptomyces flavofungini]|uniref:hypothetical protein n=1 Tax=Streptomyces flavofungini TaxID=68200 RepID=UPI0034E02C8A